jgi:hypothetical protein
MAGMESIGLPCNYHKWSQAPALPYTLITHTENDDLVADNYNYFDIGNYRLELYTATKHPPTEQLVEDWFKAQRIPYRKSSPGFIDSENMFLTAYDIQLIGG